MRVTQTAVPDIDWADKKVAAVTDSERRKTDAPIPRALERDLNEKQVSTLRSLETVGWELKFIRRKLFQDPVPVVFDGDRKKFAVLEQDGTLNEQPDFDIRG